MTQTAPKSPATKTPATIPASNLTKQEIAAGAELEISERRPKTRGDCVNGPRPCPWASCKHHLYLDVGPSGSIHLAYPKVGPEDFDKLPATCSLDLADQGGHTLEEVAVPLNVTRERIRQLEAKLLRKLRSRVAAEGIDGRDALAFFGGLHTETPLGGMEEA
jgi:hypothetical protein